MALGSLACSKYSQHQEYRLPEKCFPFISPFCIILCWNPYSHERDLKQGNLFFPRKKYGKKKKKERERNLVKKEHMSFPLAICHLSKVNECIARSVTEEKLGEVLKETLPKGQWTQLCFDFLSPIPTFYSSFLLWQTPWNVQKVLLLAGHWWFLSML